MSDTSHSPTHDQHHDHNHEPITAPHFDNGSHLGEVKNNDMVAKAATIAVVGVAAAIISAELIPGMIIGVAAAFLPGMGNKLRPFFKSTVKASYSAARKTREMFEEASEQIQDMVAEAKAEEPPIPVPPTANAHHN
jgi:Protein of unknown function (DUF5132)